VRRAQAATPHVVLFDLSMPGPRFAQTIEQLMRVASSCRVLVLTMHDDPAYLQAALQAGASGYIVKKAADVELLTAIRAVHHGRTLVDLRRPGEPALGPEVRRVSRDSPGGQPRPLSPREAQVLRQVLRLLAQGYTNQEAADQLAVSVKTIETHRRRLSDKLGLKSRAQLFRFAAEVGVSPARLAATPAGVRDCPDVRRPSGLVR